jgi:hypothetical protein
VGFEFQRIEFCLTNTAHRSAGYRVSEERKRKRKRNSGRRERQNERERGEIK